jgi:hypothetical protein
MLELSSTPESLSTQRTQLPSLSPRGWIKPWAVVSHPPSRCLAWPLERSLLPTSRGLAPTFSRPNSLLGFLTALFPTLPTLGCWTHPRTVHLLARRRSKVPCFWSTTRFPATLPPPPLLLVQPSPPPLLTRLAKGGRKHRLALARRSLFVLIPSSISQSLDQTLAAPRRAHRHRHLLHHRPGSADTQRVWTVLAAT